MIDVYYSIDCSVPRLSFGNSSLGLSSQSMMQASSSKKKEGNNHNKMRCVWDDDDVNFDTITKRALSCHKPRQSNQSMMK